MDDAEAPRVDEPEVPEIAESEGSEAPKLNEHPELNAASDGHDVQEKKPAKVMVVLKPTGGAPVRKQKKFVFPLDQTFTIVLEFIRTKYLNLSSSDSLFVYVNQAFAPSPDQRLQNLFDCFGIEGKLVLHYCLTKAWG